jgi:hypothetical protein
VAVLVLMATSLASYEQSDEEKMADDNVSLAMQNIFGLTDICLLDIADGLKQLLYEKKWALRFLIRSRPGIFSERTGN